MRSFKLLPVLFAATTYATPVDLLRVRTDCNDLSGDCSSTSTGTDPNAPSNMLGDYSVGLNHFITGSNPDTSLTPEQSGNDGYLQTPPVPNAIDENSDSFWNKPLTDKSLNNVAQVPTLAIASAVDSPTLPDTIVADTPQPEAPSGLLTGTIDSPPRPAIPLESESNLVEEPQGYCSAQCWICGVDKPGHCLPARKTTVTQSGGKNAYNLCGVKEPYKARCLKYIPSRDPDLKAWYEPTPYR